MPSSGGSTAAALEAPAAEAPSAVVEAPLKQQVAALEAQFQHPAAAGHPSTTSQTQQHGSSQISTAASPSHQRTMNRYMCYFLHRLLDFRVPELRALADMYGVKQLDIEPIPEGNTKQLLGLVGMWQPVVCGRHRHGFYVHAKQLEVSCRPAKQMILNQTPASS
jgi:hypothetical protein